LRVSPETNIDDELKTLLADVIYELPLKGSDEKLVVYILIELKTQNDRWTIFQLLKYIVRVWDKEFQRAKDEKRLKTFLFPMVIPMIFHHGAQPFTAPTELISLVRVLPGMEKYVVNLKCVLFDAAPLKEDEMPKDLELRTFFKMLQMVFSKDAAERLMKIFHEVKPNLKEPEILDEWINGVYYASTSAKHLTKEEYQEIIQTTKKERELPMAVIDEIVQEVNKKFEEGLEQGIEQGIERGREQGLEEGIEKGLEKGREEGRKEGREEGREEGKTKAKAETILRILTKRFKKIPSQIQKRLFEITNLSKLDELVDFVLDCKSLDDFKKGLK
jgi:hypothetical protein